MPHIWRTSYKADIMCPDPSIEQVLTCGAKAHVACHQVCVVFLQHLALYCTWCCIFTVLGVGQKCLAHVDNPTTLDASVTETQPREPQGTKTSS